MIAIKPLLFSFALTALTSLSAQAADTPCKGMEASACAADNACAWVPGYTRKDGVKVRSYCRAVGKGKAKAKLLEAAPAKG